MKQVYSIVTNIEDPQKGWEANLQDSMAVCPNYKTAYYVGLSISKIKFPIDSYRTSLEKIKRFGAVMIQGEDQKIFTIIKTKFVKNF